MTPAHVEGDSDVRAAEERHRSRGSGRPGDGQLAALALVDVSRALGDRPGDGRRHTHQPGRPLRAGGYEVYKQRQTVEQLFREQICVIPIHANTLFLASRGF